MRRNRVSPRTRWLGGLTILVGIAGLASSIFGPEWAQMSILPLVIGMAGIMAVSVAADARSQK
jgi:uncharacterized membrane protein YuzA (DUF378 family)